MIMIFFGAVVAFGWNRDHWALRVAQAVVAYRAGDEPADAHVLLRADYKQRGPDGFGHQDGPHLAGEELQLPSQLWLDGVEYSRDRFAVRGIYLRGFDRHSHPAQRHAVGRRRTDHVYGPQRLTGRSLACSAAQSRPARAEGERSRPTTISVMHESSRSVYCLQDCAVWAG
jgi:hypothetical protein